METNLIDGWTISVTPLASPTGQVLPVVEVAFMTRSDPTMEQKQWPTIRFRPLNAQQLIDSLAEAVRQADAAASESSSAH